MLTVEQFEPLIEAAKQTCDQCAHETDSNLRNLAERAYCDTFIAQRHSLLAERKLAEAGMARTYAAQLSAEGAFRSAERERVRAATLEQQAENHRKASEEKQDHGDQLEAEALTMLQQRSRQQKPAAPAAPPAPPPQRRVREPHGGDGDGGGQ